SYGYAEQRREVGWCRRGSPSGGNSRTTGPAAPTDVHRAGQAEDTGGDRSRTRRRHRRHPAPGRPIFLDPERLARIARRWRARRADGGQTKAEARPPQSDGGGTGAGQTGECAAAAQAGARRDDHLDPKKSCGLVGSAAGDRQRRRIMIDAVVALAPTPPPRPKPRRARDAAECQTVLTLLPAPRFADQAPAEIYACLLDEGLYHCSIRSMYRILATSQEVRERRQQLRHPVYKEPELLAQAPNEVWSWDITKLMGPAKWSYFYLYVIIDIFSRRVVGWCVAD